jgi:hypothetical protein
MTRRREFIAGISAAAWSLAARAQQSAMHRSPGFRATLSRAPLLVDLPPS